MGNCCSTTNDNKNDIRELYNLGELLGSGSFGQVRLAKLKSNSTVERAVKIIEFDEGEKGEVLDIEQDCKAADVIREVKTMMCLEHENIIRFWAFYEDPSFMYIVMDYCCGGEIFDKLLALKRFTEDHAAMIAKWILKSIVYIHEKKIVHRDIKAENFIFSTEKMEDGIKMIDFGMAAWLVPKTKEDSEEDLYLTDLCGSPHYLAPETIGTD